MFGNAGGKEGAPRRHLFLLLGWRLRACLVGLFPWHLPQKGCYHSWICVAHGHGAHSTPAYPPPKPDSWPVPSVNPAFWKCREQTPGVSLEKVVQGSGRTLR